MRIGYQLHNLGAMEENFLWAMHPLLRLETGDELELPDSTRELLNGESWVDAVTSTIPDRNCAKIFGRPLSEGWAAIQNKVKGDRLEFNWDVAENDTLGLWLTRGGWHGHHHLAIEPTNADDDLTGGHRRAKALWRCRRQKLRKLAALSAAWIMIVQSRAAKLANFSPNDFVRQVLCGLANYKYEILQCPLATIFQCIVCRGSNNGWNRFVVVAGSQADDDGLERCQG